MSMPKDLEELLALVRTLPPMTPREREVQRMGFAWGNLACSTNHKPSVAAFITLCKERGWTWEQIQEWVWDL